MITVREQLDYSTFYGLSSDIEAEKHIPNKYGYLCSRYVQNGDELIIMDTGAKYLYDESNKTWLPFSLTSTGTSTSTSPTLADKEYVIIDTTPQLIDSDTHFSANADSTEYTLNTNGKKITKITFLNDTTLMDMHFYFIDSEGNNALILADSNDRGFGAGAVKGGTIINDVSFDGLTLKVQGGGGNTYVLLELA